MVQVEIPPEYGYVLLVVAASVILMIWLGVNVGKARKKLGVPLPSLYADQAAAEKDPNKKLFNCYQRAHQNALEFYPAFLLTLTLSGIQYPRAAALLGAAWVVGRILYAYGYYSGNPDNRRWGGFHFLAVFGLVITTTLTALNLLGYI